MHILSYIFKLLDMKVGHSSLLTTNSMFDTSSKDPNQHNLNFPLLPSLQLNRYAFAFFIYY